MKRRKSDARFAYEGLDRVLHEKARLGILTALSARREGLRFNELKAFCSLTDGNLSRHLTILRESDLVDVLKGREGSRPATLVRLSKAGRQAFRRYLEELERVLEDASASASDAEPDLPSGFQPI